MALKFESNNKSGNENQKITDIENQNKPMYAGQINKHKVVIYGYIKTESRVCTNCRKMIEKGEAIFSKKPYLPCRWSNKRMNGHIS